jgi:hypothetical protein
MQGRSTACAAYSAEIGAPLSNLGIADKGRMGWQRASGYNRRARIEATMGRFKGVIGDGCKRQPMTAVFELGVDPGVRYFRQRQGSSSSMRWMG